MFGYIRPQKGQLRVWEYELFRAAYCGLCHTLGKRYGPVWRFLLNYDFCYLAVLLSSPFHPGPWTRPASWLVPVGTDDCGRTHDICNGRLRPGSRYR